MSILDKIYEGLDISPEELDDNMFLDSESETESFFDLTPSCDFDVEVSEPDFAVMDDTVIPEIKTVNGETDAEELSALASEIEEEFIKLLELPQTRENILYLTGAKRCSSKFRKDPHFAFRYAKACEYNPLISLYPKFVLRLPYDEFNAKDGNLNISAPVSKIQDLVPVV